MTLVMHAFLHDKFIQLYGGLSTTVNTGAEQYCHRGRMLTTSEKINISIYRHFCKCLYKGLCHKLSTNYVSWAK